MKNNQKQPNGNEPRISVRPGNFIVPGEAHQAPKGDNAPKSGSQPQKPQQPQKQHDHAAKGTDEGAAQSHAKRHKRGHRHNNHRDRNNEQKEQQTPKVAPQRAEQQIKNEPKNQGGGKKHRHGDRRHGAPEQKESRREAPKGQVQANAPAKPLQKSPADDTLLSTTLFSSESSGAKAKREIVEDTKEFEVDIATAAYLIEDIPTGFPAPDGKAVEVVGVRFRQAGKVYFFAPAGLHFKIGEAAIVDTARGPEFGEIVMLNRKMAQKDIVQPLRSVLRRASDEDIAHNEGNRQKEKEALALCAEKIAAHKLDMKLVDAQYTFDNSKLLFYFTSEGRVDFRDLVRDLAGVFRTRIELRQIGIRDEARLIGGLGLCGRPFCCTTFLSDFGQVSVKMAKEQGLAINTSKTSGCCGRLICCLRYEQESYAREAALTPSKHTRVKTPDGVGTVIDNTPIAGTVKVKLDGAEENEAPKTYHRDNVEIVVPNSPKATNS